MEGREDPLERLAREEREKKARLSGSNKNLFTTVVVLAIVAVLLAAFLGYKTIKTSKENTEYAELVGQLNEEKEELTKQVVALQEDFAGLSSDYDSINLQLDASREQIDELVDQIKKTEATNRAKIRQYQKELGSLRGIMRGYINQIDSLNTLNHILTEEAKEARAEAASSKRRNAKLTATVDDLSNKVAAGSVLKARGLRIDAYGTNGKITDRASRVSNMLVSLSLVANELAERGFVRVYIRVVAPDGSVISDGQTFTCVDQTLEETASREVDYEGEEVDISIYVNNVGTVQVGTYTVEAYTTGGKLGSSALSLR